jgi:alkanesulfonate monooxygenase SsuD/methylene tetrahydromethanopterin reductase-like flavin-dependent oxidoreductase (luciferase family)
MDIGIGLPNPIPGTSGATLVEWARRAEDRGFSSLATIDRIAYPSYESLISLAAAGAVTSRIGLLTNVLLGPTRNPVLLAKEAASVDQLSGGRLTLGLGVGRRKDDFELAEQPFEDRGRRFDQALELMHRIWMGEPVGEGEKPVGPRPTREGGVPILIGGTADRAIERTIRWGRGWTAGGAPPERVAPFVEKVRAAWRDSARDGDPRIVALSYFALGEKAEEGSTSYIKDYYGYLGEWVDGMARSVPKSPEAIRETVSRFREIDVDELILDPTIAELEQVDQLAEAVL